VTADGSGFPDYGGCGHAHGSVDTDRVADVDQVSGLRRQRRVYRRGGFTWFAFAGLLAIGFLQAALGPALPYLRSAENIPYLSATLLQTAFAIGGGTAGLLSAARVPAGSRALVLRAGVAGMAVAGIGLGYANAFALSVSAAFAMSLLGTSATIRFWAGLADEHRGARTVAMTEGEVSVSVGGILAPLTISAMAATMLGWRFAFILGAVAAGGVLVASVTTNIPAERGADRNKPPGAAQRTACRLPPILVVVFAVVALEWSLSFWLASYLNDDLHLGRGLAVAMVSILYAASIVGRFAASRFARRMTTERLLAISLAVAFCGLPPLVAADGAAVAAVAVAIAGFGIGASFPLASSLHVGTSNHTSTVAVGQVMATASVGQLAGPLAIGAIAETTSLRTGLIVLPLLTLLAAAALNRHVSRSPSPGVTE
jgi:fucose permease